MLRYVILDTETGGLDPETTDLLQLAWQVVDESFRTLSTRSFFLLPTLPADPQALAVNGLTPEKVKSLASDPEEAYAALLSDILGCTAIIGQYVQFDREFVKVDARRRLGPFLSRELIRTLDMAEYFDTKAATAVLREDWLSKQRPGPHLSELCEFLGVNGNGIGFHHADGDVEAVRRCMESLKEKHRHIIRGLVAA